MRKQIRIGMIFITLLIVLFQSPIVMVSADESSASEAEAQIALYAQSAVLIDADSGRVLYGKNSDQVLPMASTTKIMTCILALESGQLEETVTASANAAGQPKVHLGVWEGEQFQLKDLLYSLMLESHNDSAVMIAEHIGGSVEGFAKMMNDKAAEIGCLQTYFITPNGLDGEDEQGVHSTTAEDLAKIMRYCIIESPQKDEFLNITGTMSYSFASAEGSRSFSCVNHNAFLGMMEGALSGKTGFTNNAGYCYVGALEQDGKTFIVALLACGWPNNKTYKWSDTRELMLYGLENYEYQNIHEMITLDAITVKEGIPDSNNLQDSCTIDVYIDESDEESMEYLLRSDESVEVTYEVADQLTAPVKQGTVVGSVKYLLNNNVLKEFDIKAAESADRIQYSWCLKHTLERFLGR